MANMKDVAVRANVSVSTVSHVINGTRFVSQDAKEKVEEAMDALGYIPNVVAHSLRTKKTKTVGLVVPIGSDENSNIFIMQIVLGIDSILRQKGYFTLLTNTRDDFSREVEEIRHMLTRQIDGLIIAPSVGDHSFLPQIAADKEYVFVDRIPNGLSCSNYVVSDSFGGTYEAITGMIGCGHKKIAVLCANIGKYPNSDERLSGYKKALLDNGINPKDEYICECISTVEDGYEKAKWLTEHTDATAIFAVSNFLGMGAVKYLKEAEISIPGDISLTIFDDYTWTDIYNPSITTIRQDAYRLGSECAMLLLDKLEAKEPRCCEIRLPTEVIIRKSWKQIL